VEGRFQVNESKFVLSAQDWLSVDSLSLDPGIRLHRRVDIVDASDPAPSLWSGWKYGLDVDLGQNTWVDAEVPLTDTYGVIASRVSTVGLMGRLDGSLRAESQGTGLGLEGEVDIRKGKAKVFGTDFDVENGRLLFSGASLANPSLDIRAVYPSPQYGEIRVDIQGQPAKLQLGFSSSQGWSDTDMAAILLFKRPASSMTQSEGGVGLDILGAAIGVMAGQASQFLRMSRLVDLVEVESSGESISAIRLGWSIGDDLFLTYSQDYMAEADENASEVTLEWLLSRRLQAELSTGDAGESAADLYLRWRF
jgi:autotransporter translocation and assembly factor TamB